MVNNNNDAKVHKTHLNKNRQITTSNLLLRHCKVYDSTSTSRTGKIHQQRATNKIELILEGAQTCEPPRTNQPKILISNQKLLVLCTLREERPFLDIAAHYVTSPRFPQAQLCVPIRPLLLFRPCGIYLPSVAAAINFKLHFVSGRKFLYLDEHNHENISACAKHWLNDDGGGWLNQHQHQLARSYKSANRTDDDDGSPAYM